MSKKLINSPDKAVDEALAGLVAVHTGLTLLDGYRVVLRTDIDRIRSENKVTLLSGGGSGHEPAHGGFVGKGMLSAAVAGLVFASPPPGAILAALRAISSPAGTLMIVKNYTGDRLNFGIAAERAKTEGIKVDMVIVGEDAALSSTRKSAGRRGLCGTILVHKIAGALAEKGCSLEEVVKAAQQVADSIATMSVSLSPCSIPGHKPAFQLAEDEMELGLGIHGEAGAQRTKLLPADEVVARMIDHMTSSEPGYQYFEINPGTEVALVVNNLGGTSNLELSIMAGSAINYLTEKLKLKVVRAYMSALMTSLEMAGVSFTLLKMTPQWAECLDQSTSAPGWPTVSLGPDGSAIRTDTPPFPTKGTDKQTNLSTHLIQPTTIYGQSLRNCVSSLCTALIASEAELNRLDRGGGDGDCGTTLRAGVDAIRKVINFILWDNPYRALLAISDIVENMGGTSGAIYTIFLTSASIALEGDSEKSPQDWLKGLENGINAIKRYGGADIGDRTMLDALVPAATAFKTELGSSTDTDTAIKALVKAVEAAHSGAESTKTMDAKAGRASNVDSSLVTQVDPGAKAVAIWLEAVLNGLK